MSSDYLEARLARNALFIKIGTCEKCERRTLTSPSPKPGLGPIPSDMMLIGDVPNLNGNVAYLAQKMKNAELSLKTCYLTSVVKCAKYTPEPEEMAACLDNLRAEVDLVDPKVVVTLGSHALDAVGLGKNQITKIHGRPILMPYGPFKGRWVFPTFHPGVAYKSTHWENLLTEDLSTLYALQAGRLNLSSVSARVGRSGKLDLSVEA
jgi:uracil-DNA glycosylase